MIFHYHREAPGAGLLLGLPCLLLGYALPGPGGLLRIVFWAAGAGPVAWVLLQMLRRGRTVRLYDDYLLVQRSVTGRVSRIPYTAIRGVGLTRRGGLIIAYREMRSTHPPTGMTDGKPPTFATRPAEADEDEPLPPRQRLLLTARLNDAPTLLAALQARCDLNAPDAIPGSYMRRLAARRRLRDAVIALLLVLATPLYVMFLVRTLGLRIG